jgi:hypothetical protein
MATTKTTKKVVAKSKKDKDVARPDVRREDRPKEVEEVLGMYIGHFMTFKDKKVTPIKVNSKGRPSEFKTQLPVVGVKLMVNLIDEEGAVVRDEKGKVMHVSVNVNTREEGRLDLDDDGTSDDANAERQAIVDSITERYKMGSPVRIRQTVFRDNGWIDRDEIPPK